jgi:rhamnosyltransferase
VKQRPQTMVRNTNGVCAVIVTYNAGAEIGRCFNSVNDQVEEVVIVDNGSAPDTLSELRGLELGFSSKVIYNRDNLGIGRALNQGIGYAIHRGHRWVLTLDHDSEATPGMVEKLLEVHRSSTGNIGIVAANPYDRNIHAFKVKPRPAASDGTLVQVKGSLSSGSMIDVAAFKRIGFFNEDLFLYYVDSDFCLRLGKAGLKVLIRTDAVLIHNEGHRHYRLVFGRRIVHDGYSPGARYYISRNAVFALKKYWDDPAFCYYTITALLWHSLRAMLFDEKRFRSLCATIRGVFDGLRGRYGARLIS